jgi:D-alanine-D-alanine ligase
VRFGDAVLAERWISGREYSAPVLQGEVLPMIRIEPAATFYDYNAKYFSDATRYHCPSGLDAATSALCAPGAARIRRRRRARLGRGRLPARRSRDRLHARGQHDPGMT